MDFPNRRRNYFIDRRLQGIWALLNLTIAGIVGLLVGLEILRSFYVEFGWPLAGKPFNIPDLIFIIKLIVLALVGGGFFWLLSAFAGHRIAGPIYRLNLSLKEVAKGNYGLRIKFRRKDFFQDIANTFNEMNEAIAKRFKEKEDLLERIKEKISQLPSSEPQIQEIKELLGVK